MMNLPSMRGMVIQELEELLKRDKLKMYILKTKNYDWLNKFKVHQNLIKKPRIANF